MKRILTVFTCTIIFSQLQAQSNSIDSLKKLLSNAKEDSNKVKLLIDLSSIFNFYWPDSSFVFANQALELSKRCGYVRGEFDAMGKIANAYALMGDYSASLDMSFERLRKSEELNDKVSISQSYSNISFAYSWQGDLARSQQYVLKALELVKQIGDDSLLNILLLNIGNSYIDQSKLDSARIFINEALELSMKRNDREKIGACYYNLGVIYTQMKVYDLAKNYLYLSLQYFKPTNKLFISGVKNFISIVFDSTGSIDSSFYYARESYRVAKFTHSLDIIYFPASQLVSLFRKTHHADSALFYQDILLQIKDSLANSDKQKRIQNITFQQQLRQMQKDNEKMQQLEERKRNLQTAGVAVFIPLFFGIVLLLSRRQIKPRAVEFLGVLFLLFVFEFVTLYFHPIVGKWTHESPIWMLLIFVGIAFILVPLHHRSETWIKSQLEWQRRKELQKRVRLGEEAQKKLSQ